MGRSTIGVFQLTTVHANILPKLAVVIVSIARHRSSLAMGNIIGSTISNILGSFSLGLLFYRRHEDIVFDRSSKIYSTILLIWSAVVSGLLRFGHWNIWRIPGGIALGLFAVYVLSIAWAIYKGRISPPELSDSEDSDDEAPEEVLREAVTVNERFTDDDQDGWAGAADGLLQTPCNDTPGLTDMSTHPKNRGLLHHVALLLVGILAVILSAYVLSTAAAILVEEFGISDVLFGVVILSIATTIPEKFIAIMSGARGQTGIMVANTVGSNIFLLTLCMGILWVTTDGQFNDGSVEPTEIYVMLGSAAAMTLVVWVGGRWARVMGAAMLASYVAFLILEFVLIH